MPKTDVIDDLRAARSTLLDAINDLTDEQLLQPGAVGIWSVKDTLAHLAVWEAELVTALARIEQQKRGIPRIMEIDEDIDEWNDEQYRQNAARPLDSILADFHGVHKYLIQAVEALDDKVLDDNRQFEWMEGEPLTYLILETAVWHEEEHAADILAWRDEQEN